MLKTLYIFVLMTISHTAIAANTNPVSMKELEEMWWACDYLSTQSLASPSDAGWCSVVFEDLKSRKFAGDYAAFMIWWKENKDAQYAILGKKAS